MDLSTNAINLVVIISAIVVLLNTQYGLTQGWGYQPERIQADVFVSNVDNQCLRCLCFAATKCNLTRGCIDGYCGPYKISRIYWADAGKVVLPEDDVNRPQAFQDCALNYQCAQKIVKNYLVKYGRDCNDDQQVNCDDYMMINYNGGFMCYSSLDREENGKQWLERYYSCYPRTPDFKFDYS